MGIDFGMSRMIPALQKAGVLVGTPHFVAPEVIDGFYDKKADIWSVGVLFFLLRFGFPPFFEAADSQKKSLFLAQTLSERNALFAMIQKGFCPKVRPGKGPWF